MTIAKVTKVRLKDALEFPKNDIGAIRALKALKAGTATEDQQQLFLTWLLRDVAGLGALSFTPGDAHATSYKEGQRSIGIFLEYFLNESMVSLRKRFNLNPEE